MKINKNYDFRNNLTKTRKLRNIIKYDIESKMRACGAEMYFLVFSKRLPALCIKHLCQWRLLCVNMSALAALVSFFGSINYGVLC